jgi:hypothetical protein
MLFIALNAAVSLHSSYRHDIGPVNQNGNDLSALAGIMNDRVWRPIAAAR